MAYVPVGIEDDGSLPAEVVDRLGEKFAPHGGGAQRFVALADMKAPTLRIAAAGDSTGDELTEWLWRGVARWVTDYPDIAAAGYYGYGDSGPYTGPTDIQTSAGGFWKQYYRDEFNRTGEIVGSTPDVGLVYGGTAGQWSGDGTRAVSSGGSGAVAQDADYTAPGGRRRVSAYVDIDTTAGAQEKMFSLFLGQTTNNRVQLRLSVSTSGTQAWIINKIVAGTSTLLATGSGSPLTASAQNDNVLVRLDMQVDGTVTATVGSSTVTGTLSGGDIDAIVGGGARVWFQTGVNAASSGIAIRRIEAEKFVVSTRTLTFYNGSRAGSVAQYAIDRLEALYPQPVDLLLVSYGHNYGSETPSAFIAAIDALVTAFRANHPDAGIVLCSQNPEFSPAGNIAAHLARNAALRGYAARHGYGYLPVYELYASQTDGGQSWVQSDGIHPKRSTETADPNNGSYQAAVLLRNYLRGLSLSAS